MFNISEVIKKSIYECFNSFVVVSYDFLLVFGLISLVLYIFGWEKGKNWGMMCPAIYILLQIIVKVMSHA